MYQPKRRFIPAMMAGVLGFGVAVAVADQPATQPSQQDLQSQVQQLQSQVAQLRADQQQRQADEAAATEQVLREADQHSQMLDATSGMTGGWDAANYRFFLASEDQNFLFHPGFISQFRYIASYRSQPNNWATGFEIRRLKLYADGNFVNKDITYKVQLQNTNGPSSTAPGGTMTVEYAWMNYVLAHNLAGGDWALRAGQFKNPVYHEEEATSDNSLLMVERSMADNLAGGNSLQGPYVQGVNLQYTGNNNPLHAQLLFTDGDGSANTDFTNATSASTATIGTPSTIVSDKFGAAARADYKVFGDWTDNTDATGKNSGKHDLLVFGGGVDFSQSDTAVTTASVLDVGPPPTVTTTTVRTGTNVLRWDLDATYLASKQFIVYGSYSGDYEGFRGSYSGLGHRTDMAELLQAGYFLNPAWLVGVRGSLVELDDHFKTGGESTFGEIGAGVSYFLGDNGSAGNHAKIVCDVNYLPNGTPSITGLGYQAQAGARGEIVARLLFQLWM